MSEPLRPNIHVCQHPCVRAKLSQLRSISTPVQETQKLVNDIALLVGAEALAANLKNVDDGSDQSPLNYSYTRQSVAPAAISIVPILRSGLSMVDAISSILPHPVPVHHLGMYREKSTLQPVEYYNNLPYHKATGEAGSQSGPCELAIIVDPVIATGATACAAIETLKDWGVPKIILISILGSEQGLIRAAEEWSEAVEVWVGGCDGDLDGKGMIKPGLGDIGDRLFLTLGK